MARQMRKTGPANNAAGLHFFAKSPFPSGDEVDGPFLYLQAAFDFSPTALKGTWHITEGAPLPLPKKLTTSLV